MFERFFRRWSPSMGKEELHMAVKGTAIRIVCNMHNLPQVRDTWRGPRGSVDPSVLLPCAVGVGGLDPPQPAAG